MALELTCILIFHLNLLIFLPRVNNSTRTFKRRQYFSSPISIPFSLYWNKVLKLSCIRIFQHNWFLFLPMVNYSTKTFKRALVFPPDSPRVILPLPWFTFAFVSSPPGTFRITFADFRLLSVSFRSLVHSNTVQESPREYTLMPSVAIINWILFTEMIIAIPILPFQRYPIFVLEIPGSWMSIYMFFTFYLLS